MAGNTKLIGFVPGGKVRLERWGVYENVEIGDEAVEALREVCKEKLPSEPPVQHPEKLGVGFLVTYDYNLGCIRLALYVDEAARLNDCIACAAGDHSAADKVDVEELMRWRDKIEAALQAYRDHRDRKEPGIA